MVHLLRRRDVEARSGKRTSTLYADIAEELFVPPVKLGPRQVAWLSDEVEAINRARIAGLAQDEIRALVRRLVAARKKAVAEATLSKVAARR